jgi:hypothetical protein
MKIHRLFLAVAFLCLPVSAQQPPTPAPGGGTPAIPPAEDAGIKVRGLAFQLDNPPVDVFAHDPSLGGQIPGVKLDVKSYLNHEFNLLPFKGEEVLFTKSADPASMKDSASLVAKAKLPSNLKSGIFMFLPGTGKAGDAAFRVLVIEDANRAFPPGSFKVINLSPQSVRIELEKQKFDFRSGETRVIEDPPVGANNSSGMQAFTSNQGQVQRIASGIWPHPGTKRSLQIMFANPKTGQIEIRGVRDVAVEAQ